MVAITRTGAFGFTCKATITTVRSRCRCHRGNLERFGPVVGKHMMAKQTRMSASLVVLLAIPSVPAFAEPEAIVVQLTGEVRDPDEDTRDEREDHSVSTAPGAQDPLATPPAPPVVPLADLPRPRKPPSGSFSVGAGYSTDESFIATASVAQNDLFGTGHRLALDARLSDRQSLVRASYEVPHLLGTDLRLRGELYAKERGYVGFIRQAAGAALTLTAPVGAHTEVFVGFRAEQVSTIQTLVAPWSLHGVGGVDGTTLPSEMGGMIASLRAGVAYSTLDAPVLPRRGTSLGLSVEVADEQLGSAFQKTRVDGWASMHAPLGPFTLHLGSRVSAVTSSDPWGVLLSERLQFDGSSDIRGYAPGSIGPRDPRSGTSLGGNLMYSSRAELEVPLVPRYGISAVGFVDAGGVFDASGWGGTGVSAGFGLIWRSPIGPLRFDWAVPLDGGKPQFLFNVGSSF
ncbi:MAG: outer membrane protein assembly complex, YaeT protein [Myxococcales bacterium]|nr:outer membrane protein assembly complex, YaeT protein [Myxococcales bacterium]